MPQISSLALLASLSACGAVTATPAGSPAEAATAEPGQFVEKQYQSENGTRSYKLYLPSGYQGAEPLPLVVMLHGCTQDAADFAAGSRMNALADEGHFLVLYPEQVAGAHPQKCWNWYEPAHQVRNAGEPSLIAGMTQAVMRDYRVDPSRVYVAGVSAGGAMALTMAAAYPELYAAVASHSGVAYGAAGSVADALAVMRQGPPAASAGGDALARAMGGTTRTVPAILFHGATDPVVGAANLTAAARQWTAAQSGPDSLGVREESGAVPDGYAYTRTIYGTGPGGPAVEMWMVDGLGHAWSGGSPDGTYTDPKGPDASREIIRFFLEHPKTR